MIERVYLELLENVHHRLVNGRWELRRSPDVSQNLQCNATVSEKLEKAERESHYRMLQCSIFAVIMSGCKQTCADCYQPRGIDHDC